MSSLRVALHHRGFTTEYVVGGITATSPDDLEWPLDVFIVPNDLQGNDEVHIRVDGRKICTFYRQLDDTILTLVDHLLSEIPRRESSL